MDESIVKHLEPQVGALKLSEAIRIGARLRPQCHKRYFSDGKSCALGAAYEGWGGVYSENTGLSSFLYQTFGLSPVVMSRIIDRNDAGHTREAIADWLGTQGY